MTYLTAAMEVIKYLCTTVGQDTLRCITPVWNRERIWVTKGRMRQGLKSVLGVEELPIIMATMRLALLVMVCTHRQDH